MPDSVLWLWAERGAVLAAAFASLLAVVLGTIGIRNAGRERRSRERGQAALVLNIAYLIRRRMEGMWMTSVVSAEVWPSDTEFEMWLSWVDSDLQQATRLRERAAAVNLEVANYAELVWGYADHLRFLLGQALRAWKQNVDPHAQTPEPIARMWQRHRKGIAEAVQGILIALDRIDAVFPEHSRQVCGLPSVEHLLRADEQFRAEAVDRARRKLSGEAPSGARD